MEDVLPIAKILVWVVVKELVRVVVRARAILVAIIRNGCDLSSRQLILYR